MQPSNGNILLDKSAAQDLMDSLQIKVGTTASQQLPRGIDCSPATKLATEPAAWQMTCTPLKLTGGSSDYEDHGMPAQEPAG
ncbi:hypothetical protein C0J52_17961 [Blattella germanica]|nr:hypothetical protein C0J52_17961 [Blattella germanica]